MQHLGMAWGIWLLLSLFAARGSSRADECAECTPKKLCDPHGVVERNTLREANAKWPRAEPAERVALLESVSQLTRSHENAPSKAVVTFLARGAKDDDESVSERALDLLATGQHAETSLGALTQVIDAHLDWNTRPKLKPERKPRKLSKPLEEMTPKELEAFVKDLKAISENVDQIVAHYEELLRRHAACARVLSRIARRGDDAARASAFAYFKRLNRYCAIAPCGGCAAALLELADYAAFEAVIAGLDSYDGDGRPAPAKKAGGEPTPTYGSAVVAALDAARVRFQLPEPKPQPSGLARDVWRAWLRDNSAALGKR